MTKQEQLKTIDELLRSKIIDLLQTDNTEELTSLTPVIQYLKANAMVDKQQKDDVADEIKERIREAKLRRNRTKDL
jgi:hypothetical protein